MTTQETKSDGSAVRSSVELERVDKFDHPDHGWMWRDCEMRWIDARVAAAVLAEREACAKLMSDASLEAVAVSHERFARYSAECASMIRMRSNAVVNGG